MSGYLFPAVDCSRAALYIYFFLLSFHFITSKGETTCSQYTAPLTQTQSTPQLRLKETNVTHHELGNTDIPATLKSVDGVNIRHGTLSYLTTDEGKCSDLFNFF
jgi:hypothetical protein